MAYSPKYVNVQEIPVQIPDDYSSEDKHSALELAESAAESDLNDGSEFTNSQVIPAVEAAIKQKATCELAKGAEDPNSAKLGDLSDEGTTKSAYAMTFCDRYDEMVGRLLDTDRFSFGESTEEYVYTTSGASGSCDEQVYDRRVW